MNVSGEVVPASHELNETATTTTTTLKCDDSSKVNPFVFHLVLREFENFVSKFRQLAFSHCVLFISLLLCLLLLALLLILVSFVFRFLVFSSPRDLSVYIECV